MSEMPQIPNDSEESKKESLSELPRDISVSEKRSDMLGNNGADKPKKEKTVSLFTFILTSVALILAAVMTTYTISAAFYKQKLADTQLQQTYYGMLYSEKGFPFELVSQIVNAFNTEGVDEDAMMTAALKAYVAETGDTYAHYYSAEEYEEFRQSSAGQTEGIGINIIESIATIESQSRIVIKIH